MRSDRCEKNGKGEKEVRRDLGGISGGFCDRPVDIRFFLTQIIGRMNLSANQSLLGSSRVIGVGLNNKIDLDRKLLSALGDMLALEQESTMEKTLREYAGATDFFHFSYVNIEGEGIDSDGEPAYASDFLFDEIALSEGTEGLSAPYHGMSGRASAYISVSCCPRREADRGGLCGPDHKRL